MQCRVCLGEESPDTLVRPCRCSGTIAYIHRDCLERSCLYLPDGICRVCQTPFLRPRTWRSTGVAGVMFLGLACIAVSMPERRLVRVSALAAVVLLAYLYVRLRMLSGLHPLMVLCLWGLALSAETPASAAAAFGSLGLILAVYTLCLRVPPLVVLLGILTLILFAYLAVLTLLVFLSVGPWAFGVYVSIVYLAWNLWVHAPRLNAP